MMCVVASETKKHPAIPGGRGSASFLFGMCWAVQLQGVFKHSQGIGHMQNESTQEDCSLCSVVSYGGEISLIIINAKKRTEEMPVCFLS